MSDGELSRLEVLRDLDQRRLTATAAAQLLGLERRQVYRLLKAYRTEGPGGLISKRRGRSSNRRKPEARRGDRRHDGIGRPRPYAQPELLPRLVFGWRSQAVGRSTRSRDRARRNRAAAEPARAYGNTAELD